MIPSAYLKLAALAVAAMLGAVGAWMWQANKYERRLTDLESGYLKRDFNALERAHAETVRLQDAKDVAAKNAQVRQSALARDVAAGRDAVERLRAQLDAARARMPGDTSPAGNPYTTAVSQLLIDCADRYRGMAEKADGHASDVKTLMESWPK